MFYGLSPLSAKSSDACIFIFQRLAPQDYALASCHNAEKLCMRNHLGLMASTVSYPLWKYSLEKDVAVYARLAECLVRLECLFIAIRQHLVWFINHIIRCLRILIVWTIGNGCGTC